MKNFRTFKIAVDFYHQSQSIKVKSHLRDQLTRASQSIVLNLAEGRGKNTVKDQKRFFYIALGSLRECQAILILENLENTNIWNTLDKLGAHLYKLIQRA